MTKVIFKKSACRQGLGRQIFMNPKIKTIFLGSGVFAVAILQKLLTLDFLEVAAVITQPDKKAGRKGELTPTPVKSSMAGSNVTILQPQSLRKEQDKILEDIKPQLVIVADYGQILNSKFLTL